MGDNYSWNSAQVLNSWAYTCPYCGNSLLSNIGYIAIHRHQDGIERKIYLCHNCENPTFIDQNDDQHPGVPFGEDVQHIDSALISNLYLEARNCMQVGSYTAAVMCSRKLLMNIAVAKDAEEGKRYIEYVQYLVDKNYVPPDGSDWVDSIRAKGNQANHEIEIMTQEDAETILKFVEMLLKYIYEYPGRHKVAKQKEESE